MASLWLALAVVVLFFLLLQQLQKKFSNKKKKLPPGPRGLPLLGNLHMVGENLHQDLYKIAKKYGPIMTIRFGLVPVIVASSPHAAEQFLKNHDLVFASRPYNEVPQYMFYERRNLVSAKYGPYWRNMRKLCTLQLLSNAKIHQFQPMRKQELGILVNFLKQAASEGTVIDLSAKVASLSANMSCLMIFGKKYMDEDLGDKGFKALIQDILHIAALPNFAEFFPFLRVLDLQGFARRMKELAKLFDEFLERVIDEHVQSTEEQKQAKDMVDTLMDIMQSKEAEFEFDRRHIKAILLDLLIASMDTSSTTIEWILTELLRHPEVMKKLQNELEQVVGKNRMVEESDLKNLQYLDMVIKEGCRLHPVAPLLLPHESIEDCTVDGFHLPKGSRLLLNVWAIGRDSDTWLEPEKFKPERFQGSNVDLRGRNYELLPFGSGRRGCPGLQLGLTVVRLVVAQLVHCFDWELPNGMLPKDIDMTEKFGLVTARAQNLMAIPTYRLHIK
ncbi:cytochrome P450 71AU50-like [Nicotiana tabacum]|uniref:Cytochrome P450 71AU50-like n=2 Tax=Nicotiana TaxID=4085 RepID=A0A1S4BCI3_TOBAC|nr:PREDICTED: cytochrome P450 CYP736A12-like [Nicotiana sylvestris]XP_016486582.1 PREDICTED: cytochrome P450 CYP736A12-like [Nicotiana tabacum]